jgi:hypothetical protein
MITQSKKRVTMIENNNIINITIAEWSPSLSSHLNTQLESGALVRLCARVQDLLHPVHILALGLSLDCTLIINITTTTTTIIIIIIIIIIIAYIVRIAQCRYPRASRQRHAVLMTAGQTAPPSPPRRPRAVRA